MAVIHRHDQVFDDRNMFLLVGLGIISGCRRIAELALDCGPAAAPVGRLAESDPVLECLLGVYGFALHALDRLEAERAAQPQPPADVVTADTPLPPLRSLLV